MHLAPRKNVLVRTHAVPFCFRDNVSNILDLYPASTLATHTMPPSIAKDRRPLISSRTFIKLIYANKVQKFCLLCKRVNGAWLWTSVPGDLHFVPFCKANAPVRRRPWALYWLFNVEMKSALSWTYSIFVRVKSGNAGIRTMFLTFNAFNLIWNLDTLMWIVWVDCWCHLGFSNQSAIKYYAHVMRWNNSQKW